jgi:hypothetical protein
MNAMGRTSPPGRGARSQRRPAGSPRSGAVRLRALVRLRSAVRHAPVALAVTIAFTGCTPRKQPVIPRAAFLMRVDERHAIEGRDTTRARVTYPEFVGARTPEALDSLRATVHALLVAPAPGRSTPAGSIAALLDGFVAHWNAEREARRLREYWRFDRRVAVRSDTLGTIALVATDRAELGADGSTQIARLLLVGADDGRRMADTTFQGGAEIPDSVVAMQRLHALRRAR